jgi:hypothetical protein
MVKINRAINRFVSECSLTKIKRYFSWGGNFCYTTANNYKTKYVPIMGNNCVAFGNLLYQLQLIESITSK